MIRSALTAAIDLPFVLASQAVEVAGGATATFVTGTRRRISDVVDDVSDLAHGVHEVADDVEEFAEESFDRVGEVVDDVFEEGQDLVEDALGIHRRVWEGDGRAEIEVHGVDNPRAERLRRGLKDALERIDSVSWVEVNAITRRVAVAFDPAVSPTSALINVIEGIEHSHGVRRRRSGASRWDVEDRADHPADVEPVHRAVAAVAGNTIALGAAVTGRLTRVPRLPVEVAALTSLVDHLPWARSRAEAVLGKQAVDLVLPLLAASGNGAAQGPLGIMVDLVHHASSLTELRARRRVWEQREPHLHADHDHEDVDPPSLDPRPLPLPGGPVETSANRLSTVSLPAAAAALLATGSPRRGADVLVAGIPKAARLGREAFAAQLGRTLAARGVVPLDGSALRRLDRVDTVVLDSATLLTGRVEVADVVPLEQGPDATDPERLVTWAERLASRRSTGPDERPSGDRWSRLIRRNGWSLGGLDVSDDHEVDPLPRGTKARATEVRRSGATPLVLRHHGRAVAVVGVVDQIDTATEALVRTVRRSELSLIVAGRNGRVHERIDNDGTIPAGRAMGAAVRGLQAEGAVVAVIARRGTTGLSAADVGINVARPSGRPSWGGDLLCGPDLAEAVFVIDACAVADDVSRRSGMFAAAGSAFGTLAAVTGPAHGAGSRALAMVNGAAAISMASGAWSAVELAQRPRVVTADTTPWHRLDVNEVIRRVESTLDGLTPTQVRYRQRSARSSEREASTLEPFLAELANPLNPVLAAGAALAALVGSTVDAAMVGGLIGVNTVVGGVQRLRTERTLDSLLERSTEQTRVIRDGREIEVSEHDVVRGDLVRLVTGDTVPADCRIVESTNLEVDESNLTGESLPIAKSPEPADEDELADRTSMLYEDTTIAAGEVSAVVVATGAQTETSRSMAVAAEHGGPPESGVEIRLRELTRQVLPFAGVAAAASVTAGLLRGWPVRDVVGTGVSLAIASVPEGLPFIATAAQLASVRRLAEHDAVVRNPGTIEALGRVDQLCFDKTGTLTEGRVQLHSVTDGHVAEDVDEVSGARCDVLAAALRATDLDDESNLDIMDQAIVEAAGSAGVHAVREHAGWRAETELPFEASRGMHVVLGRHAAGHLLSVKGAPESILPHCQWSRRDGERVEFDRSEFAEISETVERLGGQGFRVLAVAERHASDRAEITTERVRDLEFVGLLAFTDPVRASSAEAVRRIRAAGVETVMITGDHPTTAEAIAAGLGMLEGNDGSTRVVMTGNDIEMLDDDELDAEIGRVAVFARTTPTQKVRVVKSFQRIGRVVAMTGDGSNDAPAIRLADVGVALGRRGTSSARDAADLVVTDDRLETIIDALAEGRAMWGSVRSAIGILVGGNLGEIGFTVVSSLFSRRAPMNARQFLLVNLVTDLAPALAVAVRPPADTTAETLLREGPESSLGASLTRDLILRAVATTAGATSAWGIARMTSTAGRASTVGLVALVGTQLGQTLVAGGGRSPTVVLTAVSSAAALVAVVQTPGLSHFFGCRPIGPLGWATATGCSAAGTLGAAIAHRRLVVGDTPAEPDRPDSSPR